jgi:hypothetical protein
MKEACMKRKIDDEQMLLSEMSIDRMKDNLQTIAKWKRHTGTEEELKAFRFVESKLQEYGLEDINIYMPELYISLPVRAEFSVEGKKLHSITHSFSASTPEAGIYADMVVYKPGKSRYDGKVVLICDRANPDYVKEAENRGAIAEVFASDGLMRYDIVSKVWGAPTPETVDYLPHTPTLTISGKDRDMLLKKLEKGPINVNIKTEVDTRWIQSPQLEARLTGNLYPDEYVLVSSHLCSWEYGAIDNASANAVLMEIANLLSKRKQQLTRSIRFVFWSGHTHGPYAGSAWYADTFWYDLHKNCVAHINIESTGPAGTEGYEAIAMVEARKFAETIIKEATGEKPIYRRMTYDSDESFMSMGVTSIFNMTSRYKGKNGFNLGWHHHTDEDLPERIDDEQYRKDASIFVKSIWRLVALNRILPYDFKAVVDEITQRIKYLNQISNGLLDLEKVAILLNKMRTLVMEFEKKTLGATDDEIRRINKTLIQLGRKISPVNCSVTGPYEHDLQEVDRPPVPSLTPLEHLIRMDKDTLEYRTILTKLIHSRNWLMDSIDMSCETLENFLR